MARVEITLPKLGESITEATLLHWLKAVGESIELDESIVEVATDKVDSELPSPYSGTILELLYEPGDVIAVGAAIAVIHTDQEIVDVPKKPQIVSTPTNQSEIVEEVVQPKARNVTRKNIAPNSYTEKALRPSKTKRFYSPLIRKIAEMEQITVAELDVIPGSGAEGRVTKSDLVQYLNYRDQEQDVNEINYTRRTKKEQRNLDYNLEEVEVFEMDRRRQLIAEHMVRSKRTAPHVTSFLEIDVTDIVTWRSSVKNEFLEKYNERLTFTPIFLEAVSKAILDFPRINASVDGTKIVVHKKVNLGMATATPDDSLIVPVIHEIQNLTLVEIAKKVNDLGQRARIGKLSPDEIRGGTFTLTNVGSFGNTLGTPIINQPQSAILSVGAIRKRPSVIETDEGDRIVIRNMMFLSLSYDHRIVDGALGGRFLRRVGDYLEQFDAARSI